MDKMMLKIDGRRVNLIAVRSARLIAIRQPKLPLGTGPQSARGPGLLFIFLPAVHQPVNGVFYTYSKGGVNMSKDLS